MDIRPGDFVSADQEKPRPSTGSHLSAHRENAVSAVTVFALGQKVVEIVGHWVLFLLVSCRRRSVTVLCHDIGDTSTVVGGDTSPE
jgi:hypothetical protein